MYRRLECITIAISAGLLLAANQATATTITTTNYATWKTDLTNTPTELNFAPVQLTNYGTAAGITLTPSGDAADPFNFTGPDKTGYVLSGYLYRFSITTLAGASDGIGVVKVTTPSAGENALWLGLGTTNNTTLTLQLSDGESILIGSGTTAIGLALSQPITYFTLSTSSGSQPFIYDIWYGNSNLPQDSGSQQSPVPESSTLGLLGGGLLILVGSQRKLLQKVFA